MNTLNLAMKTLLVGILEYFVEYCMQKKKRSASISKMNLLLIAIECIKSLSGMIDDYNLANQQKYDDIRNFLFKETYIMT